MSLSECRPCYCYLSNAASSRLSNPLHLPSSKSAPGCHPQRPAWVSSPAVHPLMALLPTRSSAAWPRSFPPRSSSFLHHPSPDPPPPTSYSHQPQLFLSPCPCRAPRLPSAHPPRSRPGREPAALSSLSQGPVLLITPHLCLHASLGAALSVAGGERGSAGRWTKWESLRRAAGRHQMAITPVSLWEAPGFDVRRLRGSQGPPSLALSLGSSSAAFVLTTLKVSGTTG